MHLSENQIPKSSIMIDFELSCHITEKYLLDIIYYFGNIIGSCVAYHFYEKIGTKVSLVIFAIIQMVCLFLLELLNVGTLKNSLIFLYIDLFFIGFSQYIVINLLFIYICDIVSLKQMPLFITTIVCGRILAGLLGVFFFEYLDLNWKHDIAIMNSVNVICLIIIIFYMVSSPKAALRNNEHLHFVKHLLKIARKNERKIKKEDFDFLVPFMDAKKKLEYDLFFNTINHRSKINSNQKDKDKINLEDND
jgi:MFS family permease